MAANPQYDASEIEPSVRVVSAVVHDLAKQSPGSFKVIKAASELVVNDTVTRVVGRLSNEYAKRAGKAHGRFEDDEINFPVQVFIRRFHAEKAISFMELSGAMMDTLNAKATKTSAGGGHVVFAHIDEQGTETLLVAIVTEEWGAALNANMDFSDTEILDLRGFRFAGRINMTEWAKGGDKYLSFLKGRSNEVSAYFKLFLGCDSSITDAAETRTLKMALEAFATEKQLEEKPRADFFNAAYDFCDKLAKIGDPINLETLANALWPSDPDALMSVMTRAELKLSDGFVPDRRALKSFVQFAAKTKSWEIKFARNAILEGEVVFNDDESLTLFNLPPDLREQLRNETKEEEENG